MMRRNLALLGILLCCLWSGGAFAETFKMANGDTLTGELLLAAANDTGVQIKVGDGKYEKVAWANFSQEDLRRFQQNPKLTAFVEPFIEIPQEDLIKRTEVKLKPVPRLERPPPQSFIGAMFSSGLGLFIVFLLYAGNIYAGYEVAIFRARPPLVVCGVSAVAPLIGPIVFLSLPTNIKPEEAAEAAAAAHPPAADAPETVNPMQSEAAEHPAGLKLHTEAPEEKPKVPPPVVFQRGQFTFNRRFIETKFSGFFGAVRREAEKDMVLLFKTTRGQYTAHRISRVAANDLHIEVHHGAATEEVLVTFTDIQEIRLQHKTAA